MYEKGAWKACCDRCGFTFFSRELRTEPLTRLKVCEWCYDPRKVDEPPRFPLERTPEWTRPRPPDTFLEPSRGIGYMVVGTSFVVCPFDRDTQPAQFEKWWHEVYIPLSLGQDVPRHKLEGRDTP